MQATSRVSAYWYTLIIICVSSTLFFVIGSYPFPSLHPQIPVPRTQKNMSLPIEVVGSLPRTQHTASLPLPPLIAIPASPPDLQKAYADHNGGTTRDEHVKSPGQSRRGDSLSREHDKADRRNTRDRRRTNAPIPSLRIQSSTRWARRCWQINLTADG